MSRRFVVRSRALAVVIALLVLVPLVAAAPAARAATVNYGPKTGKISSVSGARYITYPFPITGVSTIDATLSWATSPTGVDLNIIIKTPTGTQKAATTTAAPNPERLVYTTPATPTGNWKIVAFARKG